MRIIYIWIEKYKSIQKQEFIFRPDYNINFQRKDMCLSMDKNTESIDEILYGKNIEVTAIVGDNGVGKSTVLDFVREIIFNLKELKKNASGFIVWEQDSKLRVHSFMNQELKVNKNMESEDDIYLNEDFSLIYYSDSLDIKYYNNMFDDGEDVYTYPSEDGNYGIDLFRNREWKQYNISTSYLIKKSRGNILNYFHEEIKKQLQLYKAIKGEEDNVIPFPIPSMMIIEIMYLDLKIFNNVLDDNLLSYKYMRIGHKGENNTRSYTIGLLKELEDIYSSKRISLKPMTVDQLVQWDIFLLYLYNQLDLRKENHEDRDDYSDVDIVLKEILGPDIPDDEDSFFTLLLHCFEKETTESFYEYKDFYIFLQNFRQNKSRQGCDIRFSIPGEILNGLRETMFKEFGPDAINYDLHKQILSEDNSVELDYMKKLGWDGIWEINDFLKLFSKYSKISYNVDFFQCNWGMSSGENNLFSLFARLFDVMKSSKNQKLRNVIFLLDELDGLFHPKWQQWILKSLSKFIRTQYPEVKFQMVITTHSPVLLSDVPKENTIFIEKKSEESEQKREHEQTFAANISTLYYDSFFMDDGSVGEIAQSCIGNLIDTINETSEVNIESVVDRKKYFANMFLSKQFGEYCGMNLQDSEKLIKKIKYIIDIIGEDFWRTKITEQFNKLNLIKDDNNKIENLLSELKELEKTEGKESIRELFRRVGEIGNDTY